MGFRFLPKKILSWTGHIFGSGSKPHGQHPGARGSMFRSPKPFVTSQRDRPWWQDYCGLSTMSGCICVWSEYCTIWDLWLRTEKWFCVRLTVIAVDLSESDSTFRDKSGERKTDKTMVLHCVCARVRACVLSIFFFGVKDYRIAGLSAHRRALFISPPARTCPRRSNGFCPEHRTGAPNFVFPPSTPSRHDRFAFRSGNIRWLNGDSVCPGKLWDKREEEEEAKEERWSYSSLFNYFLTRLELNVERRPDPAEADAAARTSRASLLILAG